QPYSASTAAPCVLASHSPITTGRPRVVLEVTLKGRLLVATPALFDPNFRRAVVLVGEHGDEGAMGLVLNRPSDVTVGEAVPPLVVVAGAETRVHVGGPVQPEAVLVLAEFSDPDAAASLLVGNVGFASSEEDLDEVGAA